MHVDFDKVSWHYQGQLASSIRSNYGHRAALNQRTFLNKQTHRRKSNATAAL